MLSKGYGFTTCRGIEFASACTKLLEQKMTGGEYCSHGHPDQSSNFRAPCRTNGECSYCGQCLRSGRHVVCTAVDRSAPRCLSSAASGGCLPFVGVAVCVGPNSPAAARRWGSPIDARCGYVRMDCATRPKPVRGAPPRQRGGGVRSRGDGAHSQPRARPRGMEEQWGCVANAIALEASCRARALLPPN